MGGGFSWFSSCTSYSSSAFLDQESEDVYVLGPEAREELRAVLPFGLSHLTIPCFRELRTMHTANSEGRPGFGTQAGVSTPSS